MNWKQVLSNKYQARIAGSNKIEILNCIGHEIYVLKRAYNYYALWIDVGYIKAGEAVEGNLVVHKAFTLSEAINHIEGLK